MFLFIIFVGVWLICNATAVVERLPDRNPIYYKVGNIGCTAFTDAHKRICKTNKNCIGVGSQSSGCKHYLGISSDPSYSGFQVSNPHSKYPKGLWLLDDARETFILHDNSDGRLKYAAVDLRNVVADYIAEGTRKRDVIAKYGTIEDWDMSGVTSLDHLFDGQETFDADLSKWNTSAVKNLVYTFHNAKIFTSDLSKWNVKNVMNMQCTFMKTEAFNSDLSQWDVKKVMNMRQTFEKAFVFASDISLWDVSEVTLMDGGFRDAISFNSDISLWNVWKVELFTETFTRASKFNSDLSRWKLESATAMDSMLNDSKFNRTLCDSKWSTMKAIGNSPGLFGCCPAGSYLADPFLGVSTSTTVTSCVSCPSSTFSSVYNSYPSCEGCAKGTSTPTEGSTSCNGCPTGRIAITILPLNCSVCSAGTYQDVVHLDLNVSCQSCAVGLYIEDKSVDDTKHRSIEDCKKCPVGHEILGTDIKKCHVCGWSKYQDQEDITNVKCKTCPRNSYITDDKGEFVAHDDINDCFPCDFGKFSATIGSRGCDFCSAGQEGRGLDWESTKCEDCFVGKFSAGTSDGQNTSVCEKCPKGYYQSEEGLPYCLPCVPVSIFSLPNSFSCC